MTQIPGCAPRPHRVCNANSNAPCKGAPRPAGCAAPRQRTRNPLHLRDRAGGESQWRRINGYSSPIAAKSPFASPGRRRPWAWSRWACTRRPMRCRCTRAAPRTPAPSAAMRRKTRCGLTWTWTRCWGLPKRRVATACIRAMASSPRTRRSPSAARPRASLSSARRRRRWRCSATRCGRGSWRGRWIFPSCPAARNRWRTPRRRKRARTRSAIPSCSRRPPVAAGVACAWSRHRARWRTPSRAAAAKRKRRSAMAPCSSRS